MKSMIIGIVSVLISAATLSASTLFTFNTGLLATEGSPLTTGIAFNYALRVTEDEFGDPLAVPYFGIDASAPAVSASNPAVSGYGAPIDGDALDGLQSTIMLTFANAVDLADFSTVLDDSTFGIPAGFGTAIEFYDSGELLIGSIAVDQTVPRFNATGAATFTGVKKIVFASGAFYDNVQFTVVPEPSSALVGGIGLLLLLRRRRG